MKPITYPAIIKKDPEGYFIVSFPDWPNVNTFGNSLEEAIAMAKEALTGTLITDFERGFKIPKPSKKTSLRGKKKKALNIEPEINVSIAIQLRHLRKRKKLSQEDLANRLNISYQAYQRLEHPLKCNPTLNTLRKLSSVLGKKLKITLI